MIDLDKDLTYAETAAIEATVFTGIYAAWVAVYSRREGLSDEDIDVKAWEMAESTLDSFFDRINGLTITDAMQFAAALAKAKGEEI